MGPDEAIGYALAADLASREPHVAPDCLLAGKSGSSSLVQLNINGLGCADKPPAGLSEQLQSEAEHVIATWRDRTTGARFAAARQEHFTADELVSLREPSFGWGGGWSGHAILGYERVLREGIGGLQARIAASLDRATRDRDERRIDYLKALTHVAAGIERFIANHAAAAARLAEGAADAALRQHYQDIADSCSRITRNGAATLRDAIQLFFFIHVLEDTDSPGRIDQYLLPYYLGLSNDADERQAAARPILESLWQRFMACRSWNVCLAARPLTGRTPATSSPISSSTCRRSSVAKRPTSRCASSVAARARCSSAALRSSLKAAACRRSTTMRSSFPHSSSWASRSPLHATTP